jgi:hypothetical protein
MNIFEALKHLYTSRDLKWLKDVEENEMSAVVIQRWLVCDDRLYVQCRWLDKYVFCLSLKEYLSLAWSIIPKVNKAPFLKYISKNEQEEEFDFILSRIRKQYELSDNDYRVCKNDLIKNIKKDMKEWFIYYGIEKIHWKKYYLNFDFMKQEEKPKLTGLSAFGI